MNSEDRYWITFWVMVFTFTAAMICLAAETSDRGTAYTQTTLQKKIDNGYKYVRVLECGNTEQYKWLKPSELRQ